MIQQLPTWIILAGKLGEWLRSADALPEFLPPNALLLFQRFRDAYQAKDAARVGEQLSAAYRGTLYGLSDRTQFVQAMEETFRHLPWGTHPKLTVTMYQIIERNEPGVFEAILQFQARLAVLGVEIPWQPVDSGFVRCEARVEQPHKIWRIVRMDSVASLT